MRTRLMAVAAVASTWTLIPPARANNAAVRKQIDANYAALVRAYQAKNPKAIMATITHDYSETLSGGKTLNRQQFETSMKKLFAAVQSIRVTISLRDLRVNGKNAVVISAQTGWATFTDKRRNTHRFIESDLWKNLWTKTGEGWKIKQSSLMKSSATVDGRPLRPGPQ